MSTTSFKEKLTKAALTGAIAGAASSLIFGQSGSTGIMGIDMPVPVAIGISNAGSSIAADYAHDYVFPMLPGSQKYATIEATALGLGVSGGVTAYLLNAENIGSASTVNAFALGAASYAAGDYINSRFLSSSGGMW